ncbi:MAG: nitrous oxide reductase accessory protein NosL [Methylovulum sp.]|nr:nitrous oxide reductase accessory protein NosL [Methylovulum sp.]
MKTAIKLPLVMALFMLMLMSVRVSAHEQHEPQERPSCRVCGMWIDQYQKTAAELVYKDGSKEYTCGVACMLRLVDDEGGVSAFKSVKVHDWVTGELVDAQTATYVLGSQVIPDMVPNYIAFAKREEAEAFAAKEGGELIDFTIAYDDVSPVGTTSPFRLRTAVTPGAGNFSVGFVYGYAQKDQVKNGSDSVSPSQFINGNPVQPKAPKESQGHQQALTFNYSPTDDLALFANIPWFDRQLDTFDRSTGQVGVTNAEASGIGDILLEGRYNVWRSSHWNKFASILLGTSLPTGHFNGNRTPIPNYVPDFLKPYFATPLTQAAGLQMGKGTATFTGGLLYSQRWKDFWLHTTALYTVNPENDDKFALGDVASIGMGLHYTPTYNLMVGVEIDASYTEKNEDKGVNFGNSVIGNSGGTVSNLAFVSDYRFLNAFGGNFKLRGSIGLPVYEDLNVNPMTNAAGKPFTQVQLGDGFFANLAILWTFRDPPEY